MKHGRLANRGFRVGNIDFVVLLRQGIADYLGQDLIEYALLGAIIGIGSIVAWSQLATAVGTVDGAANTDVQAVSACTPDSGRRRVLVVADDARAQRAQLHRQA